MDVDLIFINVDNIDFCALYTILFSLVICIYHLDLFSFKRKNNKLELLFWILNNAASILQSKVYLGWTNEKFFC